MSLCSACFQPGGALECSMTGRRPFCKNLDNLFGKKFAFQYPVSELLDYKTINLAGTLTGVQGEIRCKVLAALSAVKYLQLELELA